MVYYRKPGGFSKQKCCRWEAAPGAGAPTHFCGLCVSSWYNGHSSKWEDTGLRRLCPRVCPLCKRPARVVVSAQPPVGGHRITPAVSDLCGIMWYNRENQRFSQEECLAEQKRAPHFRLGPETAILPVSAYLHGIMDTAFHYSRRLWKRLCPCVCRSKRPILG